MPRCLRRRWSSRMLPALLAELEGAHARAGRLVPQLAAGERQEDAFQAGLLDREAVDLAGMLGEEAFDEGIAARFDQYVGAVPAGAPVIGGEQLLFRSTVAPDDAQQRLAVRCFQRRRRAFGQ